VLKKLSILLILLPLNSYSIIENRVQCKHFWISSDKLIPSGKVIGEDVGKSKYGNSGLYNCEVNLTRSNVELGQYLFLGEIGDSSFFKLTKINGNNMDLPSIPHGLFINHSLKTKYMRVLPFIIPLRNFYQEDGKYNFYIKYKNIIGSQIGMRSGIPTIESFYGALKRFFLNSPTLTIYSIQIAYFLFSFFSFLFLPNINFNRRIIVSMAALFSGLSLLQFTALPRLILSPEVAMRSMYVVQMIAYWFIITAYRFYFSEPIGQKKNIVWKSYPFFCGFGILLTLFTPASFNTNYIYRMLLGIPFFFFLCYFPVSLGWNIFRNKLQPVFTFKQKLLAAKLFILVGFFGLFDIINFTLLFSKFYYLNHFTFFLTSIYFMRHFQHLESSNTNKLLSDLNDLKNFSFSSLSDNHMKISETLDALAKKVSEILLCSRVSIMEHVDGNLKFLGTYGAYKKTNQLVKIPVDSLISECIKTKTMQKGRLPIKASPKKKTDYFILPIVSNDKIKGVICLTEFQNGRFSLFFNKNLKTIRRELELIYNLLVFEKHNKAQTQLLKLFRNKIHYLQIESEEFFLNHFDLSENINGHAFIVADLVDSTILNENYGGNKIQNVIDSHLNLLWKNFKHLGIVISRSKGDFISIMVPYQASDEVQSNAVNRAIQVLDFMEKEMNEEFKKISKGLGVALPLRYRVVMSVATDKLTLSPETETESLTNFNLQVDAAIDGSFRILNNVAIPGECLLSEDAFSLLESKSEFIEISPQRLKGKLRSSKIYAFKSSLNKNKEVA